jgi:membrane fusion protein, multidrug efflux system
MRFSLPVYRSALLLASTALLACGGGAPPASTAGGGGGPGGGGGAGGRPGGGGPGGPGGRAPQITPVEITLVERADLANTSLVTGLLEPLRTVSVNAQLGGALLAVRVEEGARVSAGQTLAEIDARELAAQVKAAEAQLTFARSTAERSAQLFTQQIITAAENERDQAALASAEASLTQLRTRLGFSVIASPISGVVTARFVQGGDIVSPNTRLFTVSDVSTLVVRMPVSELEVAQLRTGQDVALKVDALGGATVSGRVRRIFPSADSLSRLVPVEVAVTGSATSQLRPGYTVRATLKLDSRPDALVLPTRAVIGASGARSVFIVKGGLAERRAVRVGADIDGKVEVFSGLALGDTVIVAGNSLVREGGQVRIVDPLAPETRAGVAGAPAAVGNTDSTSLSSARTTP